MTIGESRTNHGVNRPVTLRSVASRRRSAPMSWCAIVIIFEEWNQLGDAQKYTRRRVCVCTRHPALGSKSSVTHGVPGSWTDSPKLSKVVQRDGRDTLRRRSDATSAAARAPCRYSGRPRQRRTGRPSRAAPPPSTRHRGGATQEGGELIAHVVQQPAGCAKTCVQLVWDLLCAFAGSPLIGAAAAAHTYTRQARRGRGGVP